MTPAISEHQDNSIRAVPVTAERAWWDLVKHYQLAIDIDVSNKSVLLVPIPS